MDRQFQLSILPESHLAVAQRQQNQWRGGVTVLSCVNLIQPYSLVEQDNCFSL
uniref:Uncharacterized protein n=1 Tax=Kalanchoe fedtschenkoi TaxID=63787 RepID=A0A7N0UHT2_KALFE